MKHRVIYVMRIKQSRIHSILGQLYFSEELFSEESRMRDN